MLLAEGDRTEREEVMNSEEVPRACPFCGSPDTTRRVGLSFDRWTFNTSADIYQRVTEWMVHCNECRRDFHLEMPTRVEKEAIQAA